MAAKAKGVCLAGTVEHDGKRYAPGMPVPLSKLEGERLTKKLGEWEGDPVQGEPVPVGRAVSRRAASVTTAGGSSGTAMVVMTQEQFDGVIDATTQKVAAQVSEALGVSFAEQVTALTGQLDKAIADAAAAGAMAVIDGLNGESEAPAEASPAAPDEGAAPETDAKAS